MNSEKNGKTTKQKKKKLNDLEVIQIGTIRFGCRNGKALGKEKKWKRKSIDGHKQCISTGWPWSVYEFENILLENCLRNELKTTFLLRFSVNKEHTIPTDSKHLLYIRRIRKKNHWNEWFFVCKTFKSNWIISTNWHNEDDGASLVWHCQYLLLQSKRANVIYSNKWNCILCQYISIYEDNFIIY